PIGHSASPAMHNAALASCEPGFVYVPFDVEDICEFVSRVIRPGSREVDMDYRGLSVTIPHKAAALSLVDELDATAGSVGAVNTLVIKDGKLLGYNTDVRGAVEPLERIVTISRERFAVIGAGGAARAVVCGLKSRGASVEVFARDPAKAAWMTERLKVRVI